VLKKRNRFVMASAPKKVINMFLAWICRYLQLLAGREAFAAFFADFRRLDVVLLARVHTQGLCI
jgi:hypothetical protein